MRGSRPGERRGGRKKGTKNYRHKLPAPKIEKPAPFLIRGVTPLEHMLEAMRAPMPTQMDNEDPATFMARCKWHISRQDANANAAAPYIHPRLSATVNKQGEDVLPSIYDPLDIAKRVAMSVREAQEATRKAQESAREAEHAEGN